MYHSYMNYKEGKRYKAENKKAIVRNAEKEEKDITVWNMFAFVLSNRLTLNSC